MRASSVGGQIAAFLVALLALATPSEAQERPPRITVRVRQVAGSSVYLDVGTKDGLAAGDTLAVFRDSTDRAPERLVVVASSESRSVLTFAGAPFPLTRGASLTLQLLRRPGEAAAIPAGETSKERTGEISKAVVEVPLPQREPAVSTPGPSLGEGASTPRPGRPAHGRLTFGFSGVRSSTQFGGSDPVNVDRTFATPAMGLVLTVPDAVGRLQLRTNMRLEYRYSNQDIIQPSLATRVYAAALEGEFDRFRVALGRFHSPVEPFSGFWDGALLRVGRPGLGIGAIAGFEPDRWNQSPSSSIPKATLFVDGRSRGDGWLWSGNLSAHEVRPRNGEAQHTFFGASQRLSTGALYFSQDLEVDRDPLSGSWKLSRLLVRGSVQLVRGLDLRAGVAREQPWIPGLTGSPFGYRRDRANAGLAYHGPGGYLAVDASMGRDVSGERTWGGTGIFSLSRLPGMPRVGLSASVARWSGAYGTSETAAPTLSFDLAPARLRLGYRISRNDYLRDRLTTHAGEAALDLPFASEFRLSARARMQFGGYLSSQSFDLGLSRSF